MKLRSYIILFSIILTLMLLSGCLTKVDRTVTKYYVLDYKKATENPDLHIDEAFPTTLEVLDAEVNRTYSRNQLIIKDNFSRVRYLPFDLWANRLSDAVPNLIVQRLRAYNIFRQVDRSTGEIDPDYFLETSILNLEKIDSAEPKAYLRVEFYLRNADTQKVLFTYKAERYKELPELSMVYLIQSYNEMLMAETDILAARCRLFLEGKDVADIQPKTELTALENFVYAEAAKTAQITSDGELELRLKTPTSSEIRYSIEGMDAKTNPISRNDGEFNKIITLKPGKYKITIGENQEIPIVAEVFANMRTVVHNEWAELVVNVIDDNQTKVRLPYDVWKKNIVKYDYYPYGTDTSIGDDDLGQPDKVWILPPGKYMVKLGGGSWNDLVNFTTVNLNKGDREILTLVVDPSGEGNLLVGAGILGEEKKIIDRAVIHKGALHGNISLAGNNDVASNDPSYNVTVTGQLENNLEATYPMTQLTTRSIYDLGLNSSTESDLRISTDSYSLKNVLLFTPWERNEILRDFSFYCRADMQTHFFNEITHFSQNKNLIMISANGDTLSIEAGQDRIQSKSALFPMRLKEGAGITYRLVINPRVSLSLRGGYGWQQEINDHSYSLTGTGSSQVPGDTISYDIYSENQNQTYHGFESTLVLSAMNIFNFIRINSTFDVLFPMASPTRSTRFESENRINFRVYRNISLDVKFNVLYDKSIKDWAVYDYGSYLRLSLYF